MPTYTPSEFLSFLERREKRTVSEIAVSGFAKADATDADGFLFSPGTNCEGWIRIAAEAFVSARHLGTVPCGDHEHAYVSVVLRPPPDDNGPARLFYQLLTARYADAIAAEATAIAGRLNQRDNTRTSPGGSAARCIVYQGMEGLYVCCPPEPGSGGGWVCTGMV